jgi:hypothetical protein
MIFADFYKSPRSPLAKLRHHQSSNPNQTDTPQSKSPDWSADVHADLLSKDKHKVKEAVKQYLASKVRNDWEFVWPRPATADAVAEPAAAASPPPNPDVSPLDGTTDVQDELRDDKGYQNDDTDSDLPEDGEADDRNNDDAISVYSIVSENPTHYRAMVEWDSDVPADDLEPSTSDHGSNHHTTEHVSQLERQAQKRRELRKEMEYNDGLACFEARRAAWTQARTVRVRAKAEVPSPTTPQHSPRRLFFRRSSRSASGASQNGQSPGATLAALASSPDGAPEKDADRSSSKHSKKDSTCSDSSDTNLYPVQILVPVPGPILPPNNPLRLSIQPSHYLQLYDKLIANSLTPSCPINLADMLPACVAGWKRDGEWPPRPALPVDPIFAAYKSQKKKRASNDNAPSGRRMSLTGLLSRDKDGDARPGKSVRHSLQRALGLGSHTEPSVAKGN